jgi:homogentisate 1,2-dioxygenase
MARAQDDMPHNDGLVEEDGIVYQTGFGNSFESEALQNALPRGRNNPRQVPFGLYTEQLSGTAFTAPRSVNRRTWLYRIQPSVVGSHALLQLSEQEFFGQSCDPSCFQVNPNPMRWKPMPLELGDGCNFVTGLKTLMASGSPLGKDGLSISMYAFSQDMVDTHFYNSDGDFLIVPQYGSLLIYTELGRLIVHPKEICVIPRGIVFSVHQHDSSADVVARGYVLEVYKGHFQLPELGPIGASGLANVRDFMHPTAWYVSDKHNYKKPCTIFNKYGGKLFFRLGSHSPYNVVAWHGNYLPFKYNLERFCAVNSVTYDHLDPSIYTVLTAVGNEAGTALADFVIFPPRVLATDDDTLRPPWFHRNTMSEFMGLIWGSYDAKAEFQPGGATLHPTMTPHGPDAISYEKAVQADCSKPTKFEGGLAFMFETSHMMKLSPYALNCEHRDLPYAECWIDLHDTFTEWPESHHKREHEEEED